MSHCHFVTWIQKGFFIIIIWRDIPDSVLCSPFPLFFSFHIKERQENTFIRVVEPVKIKGLYQPIAYDQILAGALFALYMLNMCSTEQISECKWVLISISTVPWQKHTVLCFSFLFLEDTFILK